MLKISDFAEIAQVSVSALRYYNEIGILLPAHIDQTTGYRYYTLDQMMRLNRILALKDLGIDLTQIAQLLDEDISIEAFRGMLKLRKVQLQQTIQAAQDQLSRIEARLDYIERGGGDVVPEVVLKTVKAMPTISSFTQRVGFMPNAEYADAFLAMLRRHRVKVDGYAQYVYHRSTKPDLNFDIELAVPVESPATHALHKLEWREEIMMRELPEVPMMASAVYQGSPYTIINALQSLGAWIEENGYTIVGAGRKVCLQWHGTLTDYITEMQFPVAQQVISN